MKRSLVAGGWIALSVLSAGCASSGGADTPNNGSAGALSSSGAANDGGGQSSAAAGSSVNTAGASGAPGSGGAIGSGGAAGSVNLGGSAGTSGASSSGGSAGSGAGSGFNLPAGTPSTVLLDGATLAKTQAALAGGTAGTPAQQAALKNLIAAADLALKSGTWSVTTKAAAYVVNGDPHEYVSWGPYWWPSDANPPNTPGTFGKCPYVSHDGQHNPDVAKVTDRHGLHASSEAILELSLAWYFTGNTAYADQAELVARTWFLNAATAMNPTMAHAQSQGPCGSGTATGIIETAGYLTDALDGLSLLALDTRANGWALADQAGMKAWLGKFITFLKTSSVGKAEAGATNNHGTWYDATLSSIYLFTGDTDSTKALVLASRKRMDSQLLGDGRQPEELARQTSWHYSNYNAAALCRLADVAKHVGVDLWGYQTPNGATIAKAIAYLIPTAISANPPGPWAQYNDITVPFDPAYQAEAYYSIHAAAANGNAAAQAVFAVQPAAVPVPGHYCAGDRFPLGSDFCGITPGAQAFQDLQAADAPAVDMWPLLPTCRVPIN